MDKFDHFILLIERSVKLQEEIVSELKSLKAAIPGLISSSLPNAEPIAAMEETCPEVAPIIGTPDPEPENWVDLLDLQNILKISRRTAYRIRDDKSVRWVKVRGRIHFYKPDIFKLTDEYLK